MIDALSTLSDLPGVRFVLLTSLDGVPIASPDGSGGASEAGLGSEDALAALTAVWLSEVGRQSSQVSWNEPRRAVLRAARGTLILQRLKNAVLLVLLARGTEPEDVRLAMEGTAARIDRSVRSMGRTTEAPAANPSGSQAGTPSEPRSPLPASAPSDQEERDRAVKGLESEDPSGN